MDSLDYARVMSAALRHPGRAPEPSVMDRSAGPEWRPEYEQEPPLEAVNPEDFVPSPKALVAALKALGPAALKALGPAAMVGMVGKKAPRKMTEFEQRHAVAQSNAALPVEQGGLGLPLNNTAMDRARAMGFDTPVYRGQKGNLHGVVAKRSPSNEQLSLSSVHVAENPEYASRYANSMGDVVVPMLMRRGNLVDATTLVREGTDKFNILKALLPKGQKPYLSRGGEGLPTDPLVAPPLQSYIDAAGAKKAERVFEGKDAIKYQATYGSIGAPGQGMKVDVKSPAYAVLTPANLRSRFAAFDPMRRHEADLLGNIDPQLLKYLAAGSTGAVTAPVVIDALRNREGDK